MTSRISARIVQQAIRIYLETVYPGGVGGSAAGPAVPAATSQKIAPIQQLAPEQEVPLSLLEKDPALSCAYALRLGQPMYPHMKLVLESVPPTAERPDGIWFLRVDTHDRHLHAAPGSPDAAWLASIRTSNKELTDRIEAGWAKESLPTFKEYLRLQLEARKASRVTG